ncbi:hypothetical protein [Actinorugispora endophytica]|uniref:hypothetical protein n=1 Tax=Actinorugispora endophytica TaxID=1605990 RepID=UPI001FB65B3A|nr:hypothetical protein [Actinorugispora endophytica]
MLVPSPGPPPRRPAPEEHSDVSAEWVAAQRRSEADINRPLLFVLLALVAIGTVLVLLAMLGAMPFFLAATGWVACLAVALPVVVALMQSRQAVGDRLADERDRRALELEEKRRLLRERQEAHAAEYTEWQTRRRAYEAQPRWHAVEVPPGTGRVVVTGGANVGWSALLTTIGAARLRDGGDLTVVDLSGRAAAGEFVSLVQRCGLIPRVWVLPADLPRMKLGSDLDAAHRADILASTVLAIDPRADIEADRTILVKVFDVLGEDTAIMRVTAALGMLGLPGAADTRDDPALALLSEYERKELRAAFTGDTAAMERAPDLQRALTPFEGLGSRAEQEPYAQVKIIATDRSTGEFAGRAYGTYTLDSLSELLDLRARRGGTGRPWARTIVLCGADTLPGWAVERLVHAAERVSVGLVLMYRETDGNALSWLGADGTLPVVMRQPGAGSAAATAAFLGAGSRGRVHRLTEVVGTALDESAADGYVTDTAESVTAAVPVRYTARSIAPLDLVRHIRSATAWGRATAHAAENDDPVDDDGTDRLTDRRLDTYGLQQLPPTAMVLPAPSGGPVVADANPGILTLATATLTPVGDPAPERIVRPEEEPPANIGPPPERLDWRG